MIDGSVCNVLSNKNSASTCYISGATPKEMNMAAVNEILPKEENKRFGLSTLSSWIRCFECLLHISYRLPFKTWQVRDTANKIIFAERDDFSKIQRPPQKLPKLMKIFYKNFARS